MQPTLLKMADTQQVFLPEEFILGLKTALEEKRRLLAQLPQEIEELSKRYEAALNFAPPGFDSSKEPIAADITERAAKRPTFVLRRPLTPVATKAKPVKPPTPEKPAGWRRALVVILNKERSGLSHKALNARAKAEFPHLTASEGEKSYYSAIGKLIDSGAAVKYGNLIFAAEALLEAKAKGVLPPLPDVGRRAGSSAEMIVELLREYPAGLTANDMRERFRVMPNAPKSLYEHGQYIYGILGPMLGRSEVVKEGELYRLGSAESKK